MQPVCGSVMPTLPPANSHSDCKMLAQKQHGFSAVAYMQWKYSTVLVCSAHDECVSQHVATLNITH